MVHPNTERLLVYWKSRRAGEGDAPLRSAIDPSGFAPLLPQVFILGRRGPGDWRFRLAGGLVADLHGRDPRDTDGLALWAPQARMQLSACLEAARRKGQAFVVTARGRTASGRGVELEVLYAPLRASAGGPERCLGLYQPLTPLAHLGARPLERLELTDIGAADPGERLPSLQLAVLDGRRIA